MKGLASKFQTNKKVGDGKKVLIYSIFHSFMFLGTFIVVSWGLEVPIMKGHTILINHFILHEKLLHFWCFPTRVLGDPRVPLKRTTNFTQLIENMAQLPHMMRFLAI